jgi:hypothetical protein
VGDFTFIFHILEAEDFKVNVLADVVSSKDPLSSVRMAPLSLYLHMFESEVISLLLLLVRA